jgi:hypothetical protein
VSDGGDQPGDWYPSESGESSEPPAALLRRAISHVESLLHRLDPSDAPDAPSLPAPITQLPVSAIPSEPLPIEPLVVSEEPPGTSSTAQADALLRSLRVHEQAHRLRAEASGARAEAAAESERILAEARELSERVRSEARESVAEMLGIARREAAVVIDAARAEADRIREAALADHDQRLAEFEEVAERDRAAAAASIRELLDEATRDADRILEHARDRGRAEAARLIEAEVTAAVTEARESVQDSQRQAHELLSGAYASVEDARVTLRQLIDGLNESLVALNSSAETITTLLGALPAHLPEPREPAEDEPVEAAGRHAGEPWSERRPLGLLFGATGS